MRCGLLGEKLGHSYSPQIHALLGEYDYALFEKDANELEHFLTGCEFQGLNVTIPYKKSVIPYCDRLSLEAQKLGAVNTITRDPDGKLTGHNTDYYGFQYMLSKSMLALSGKKVLVLGSGGAAVTVFSVLKEAGAIPVMISRNGENNYQNLHIHKDAAIIVNATPVGMYPNTGPTPIDIKQFPLLEGALDLIYNPARTQFLLDAEENGLVALNGLWMLIAQAKKSAELFLNQTLPDNVIDSIYFKLSREMQNTVLIGMPGCGKSTIGKLLAEMLGKKFIDADQCVEKLAHKSIPEIFFSDGEAAFRAYETQVLEDLGKKSGLVIATGGGCVTQAKNYPLLRQNSRIIWIKRDLNALPTEGRPISQNSSLQLIFEQRQPLYEKFADYAVENDDLPSVVAARIAALEV